MDMLNTCAKFQGPSLQVDIWTLCSAEKCVTYVVALKLPTSLV